MRPGVPLPRSLRNIYQELSDDLGCPPPPDGSLLPWAQQGVLLLNSVLTVAAGQAGSHQKLGWQWLTDEIIQSLARLPQPIVFVLWGGWARSKAPLHRLPAPAAGAGECPSKPALRPAGLLREPPLQCRQ